MKKLIRVTALLCTLFLLLSLAAFADDPWTEEYYRVIDYTDTLSDAQVESLDGDCMEMLRTYQLDMLRQPGKLGAGRL